MWIRKCYNHRKKSKRWFTWDLTNYFGWCRTCKNLDQLVDNFSEAVRIDADARRTEKTRVVIVGAGIAGLAAAKTLEDAGFTDYLLLEGTSTHLC